MKIILASNSPRRKELLATLTTEFDVIPSTCEEISFAADPKVFVCELATHKAQDVFQKHPDALVIGCDTVVDFDGHILGKPATEAEATQMLKDLSGNTHFVHTGVCILCGSQTYCFCESTAVTFRKLSPQEIATYVASGAPMDKAGAYGIQECGFVQSFSGSYNNVVGFPTEKIAEILKLIKG